MSPMHSKSNANLSLILISSICTYVFSTFANNTRESLGLLSNTFFFDHVRFKGQKNMHFLQQMNQNLLEKCFMNADDMSFQTISQREIFLT